MKRLLTLMVFWCAIAISAPITAQMLAAHDSDNPPEPAVLGPEDSGWYGRADAGFHQNQCNVLVDAVPVNGGCMYRLSAMCVQAGQGSVVGISQQDVPHKAPITLLLYQPPSLDPVGYLEIAALGVAPQLGLNQFATPWHRAASYRGQWCEQRGRWR